ANPDWARRPSPIPAPINPASIVEWSVAPGIIVDPGPSPWILPNPLAVAIRSPSCRHVVRHPNVAVLIAMLPVSVLVEVFVADHVRRNVTCGRGVIKFLIPRTRPLVERIWRGRGMNVICRERSLAEPRLLIFADFHRLPIG